MTPLSRMSPLWKGAHIPLIPNIVPGFGSRVACEFHRITACTNGPADFQKFQEHNRCLLVLRLFRTHTHTHSHATNTQRSQRGTKARQKDRICLCPQSHNTHAQRVRDRHRRAIDTGTALAAKLTRVHRKDGRHCNTSRNNTIPLRAPRIYFNNNDGNIIMYRPGL